MSIESSEEEVFASNSGSENPDKTGSDGLTGFSGIETNENDDEEEDCAQFVAKVSNRGYHNLETFQRKKLKQKVQFKLKPDKLSNWPISTINKTRPVKTDFTYRFGFGLVDKFYLIRVDKSQDL